MKIVRASQGLRPKGPLLKSSPVVGSRPSTDGIWGGATHFCGSPRHRHHQNHQVRIRTFVAPRVIIKQQRWAPPPGREHRLPRPLCGSPCHHHHQTTHPCASGVAKSAKINALGSLPGTGPTHIFSSENPKKVTSVSHGSRKGHKRVPSLPFSTPNVFSSGKLDRGTWTCIRAGHPATHGCEMHPHQQATHAWTHHDHIPTIPTTPTRDHVPFRTYCSVTNSRTRARAQCPGPDHGLLQTE